MSKDEILNILPTPVGDEFAKIKDSSPYSIMLHYANAINEKYNGKLSATITESSMTESSDSSATIISYAFYINAPIGRGYFYRLFEVIPEKEISYPVNIKLFKKNTQDFGKAVSAEEFNSKLLSIFKSGFTSTLLLNLLAQIDLYNENKNKK